jgi:putative Ca2+/H+ antiporter (TMEM165/GDT1 family)
MKSTFCTGIGRCGVCVVVWRVFYFPQNTTHNNNKIIVVVATIATLLSTQKVQNAWTSKRIQSIISSTVSLFFFSEI